MQRRVSRAIGFSNESYSLLRSRTSGANTAFSNSPRPRGDPRFDGGSSRGMWRAF